MDRPLRGLPGRSASGGGDDRHLPPVDEGQRRVPSLPFRRELLTRDPIMRRVLETARSVADSRAPVLLEGESGTGKELVARLVHACSPRRARPFVAVNCAAMPHELLESELFGHERGAFTGALGRKLGKFELADGGTLLLDEIGEMDVRLQAKLLRVLQEWEIDRVGGTAAIPVDVRIVATTNRRLGDLVERGGFRQDLFYRLMVVPLVLPPLRARRADVGLLARYFLERFRGERPLGLSAAALAALEARPWPGNVRELEHVVERAVLLARGLEIEPADLEDAAAAPPRLPLGSLAGFTVRELERRLILDTLERTADNRTQAARLLGISIRTLRNKLAEYRRNGELPTRLASPRQPEPAR
jgi:two-component system response regulator FlrC